MYFSQKIKVTFQSGHLGKYPLRSFTLSNLEQGAATWEEESGGHHDDNSNDDNSNDDNSNDDNLDPSDSSNVEYLLVVSDIEQLNVLITHLRRM